MKFIRKYLVWILLLGMVALYLVTRDNLREEREDRKKYRSTIEAYKANEERLIEEFRKAEIKADQHRGNEYAYRDSFYTAQKKYQALIIYHEKSMEGVYDMPALDAYIGLKDWLRAE